MPEQNTSDMSEWYATIARMAGRDEAPECGSSSDPSFGFNACMPKSPDSVSECYYFHLN